MKMSELVNELLERIKTYGDAEIILRDKNNCDKEIFDVFFDVFNSNKFVIIFK